MVTTRITRITDSEKLVSICGSPSIGWPPFTKGSVLASIAWMMSFTPMFIVILALGMTDLLFALDSIPAIYGLTDAPYIVFTANAFALLGLLQLYFLLGGLLDRLVYLGIGLSLILAFIGGKLIIHAMEANTLSFINGGQPIEGLPHIETEFSLAVIVGILVVTTVLSLLKSRRDARKLTGMNDEGQ